MSKVDQYGAKTRRRRPKRCTLAIYHTGSAILFIGIIVAIIGVATNRLFHVYVYDHRKPAQFLHVHIPVGLFSHGAEVTWLSLAQDKLPHGLELNDCQWTGARVLTVIGVLAAIGAFVMHIVFSCLQIHRSWTTILIELCSLLVAVITILIGLSLAESEIEVIHDHGDAALTRLLVSNGLLVDSDLKALQTSGQESGASASQSQSGFSNDDIALEASGSRGAVSGGDFALFLSPPQMSFALLIAAEFLILLAFLAVLIYFVRVCEKAEESRKQMRRAETSQI